MFFESYRLTYNKRIYAPITYIRHISKQKHTTSFKMYCRPAAIQVTWRDSDFTAVGRFVGNFAMQCASEVGLY
jgi:hypothetical protein